MNGTAFSASMASLALHDAVHLALLAQVCTAMGTEALLGVRSNYDPFIHEVARPHPGQVRFAELGSFSRWCDWRVLLHSGGGRAYDLGSFEGEQARRWTREGRDH
jgi:Aromatic amino acid lyase